MIYTLTFNPAVDYVINIDKISLGVVNRCEKENIYFGGKGINISVVLARLGVKSKALGFVAGFTGEAIEKGVQEMGAETDFIHLKNGYSRINVKIKSAEETEINGRGPQIDSESLSKLFEKLDNLKSGDTLTIAGSIPDSLPSDIYEQILRKLSGRGINFAVDAEKNLLLKTLKYRPLVIKPNIHELGDIFGRKLSAENGSEIFEHALELQKMGAKNVLVSMAGDGSVLVTEDGRRYICGALKGTVKNSVGAGDSMLAGFIAGIPQGFEHALRLGTACGSATAFSEGLAERDLIDKLFESTGELVRCLNQKI